MKTLKQEVLNVISKLPGTADIDEIMYRLYVIDKVRNGKEAIACELSAFMWAIAGEVPVEI